MAVEAYASDERGGRWPAASFGALRVHKQHKHEKAFCRAKNTAEYDYTLALEKWQGKSAMQKKDRHTGTFAADEGIPVNIPPGQGPFVHFTCVQGIMRLCHPARLRKELAADLV